jgi:hypothetical protein
MKPQNKMEQLLYKLGTEWGFCIPQSEQEKILNKENINPEEFACAVLEAEDMNPEYEAKWVKNKFIEECDNES